MAICTNILINKLALKAAVLVGKYHIKDSLKRDLETQKIMVSALFNIIKNNMNNQEMVSESGEYSPDFLDIFNTSLIILQGARYEVVGNKAFNEGWFLAEDENGNELPFESLIDKYGIIIPNKYRSDTKFITEPPLEFTIEDIDTTTKIGIEEGVKEGLSIDNLLKRGLGDHAFKFEEMRDFFHRVVSTTWIDQRVRPDGTTVGFSGPVNAMNNIKAALLNRVLQAYKDSSIAHIVHDGITYFIVKELPKGVNVVSGTINGKIQNITLAGKLQYLLNNKENVRFIEYDFTKDTSDVVNSTIEDIRNTLDSKSAVVVKNNKPLIDLPKISLDGPISDKDYPVMYADVIHKYFRIFVDNYYPQLSESYETSVRKGHSDGDNPILALDQESKSLKLHKYTTPRLVLIDSGADIEVQESSINKYLTSTDYDLLSKVARKQGWPNNLEDIKRGMRLFFENTNENRTERSIVASIYYRFFADTPYTINNYTGIDGKTETATFKSYSAIYNSDRTRTALDENGNSRPVEIQEYLSTDNSLFNDNNALDDAVSEILRSIVSTIDEENIMSTNGNMQKTNSASYGTLDNIREAFKIGVDNISDISAKRNLDVSISGSGTYMDPYRLLITDKNTAQVDATFTVNFKTTNAPITFLNINGNSVRGNRIDTNILSKILREVGFGNGTISNEKFLKAIAAGNEETTATELGLSFIILLQANRPVINNVGGSPISIDSELEGNGLRVDPIQALHYYKDILSTAYTTLFGNNSRKVALDHLKNKLAIQGVAHKLGKFLQTIKSAVKAGATNINNNTPITNGTYKFLGMYNKTGIKVGDVIKSNANMSVLEQAHYQIEQAFLQNLVFTKFKQVLIQVGVMSDRTKIPMYNFEINNSEFMPVNSRTKGLNHTFLREEFKLAQRSYWNNLANVTSSKWKKLLPEEYVNMSLAELAIAVENTALPYETVSSTSDLVKNSMLTSKPTTYRDKLKILSNIINSGQYVPDLSNEDNQEIYTEAKRLFELEISTEKLPEENSTMIDYFIHSLQLPETVKSLISSKAVIPTPLVENVYLFSNIDNPMLDVFIDNNLAIFKKDLEEIGYTTIRSEKLDNALAHRFPNAKTTEERYNTLVTAYFYHWNTLAHNSLDIQTGGFIQYKLDNKFTNRFLSSFINPSNLENDITAKAAIEEALSDIKVNGLSITDPTLTQDTVKNTKNSQTIFYHAVINNTNLSDKQKLEALMLDEVGHTQSTQFIDQLKRNAMLGSNIQSPRLENLNKPGVLLGQSSKCVTFNDLKELTTIIGKGKVSVDAYDAAMVVHPLYSIKLSRSMGGKESPYRPMGGAIKSITNATDENGVVTGQKKAEFELFNNEFLAKGTSTLLNKFKKMNEAINFDPVAGEPISIMVYSTTDTGDKFQVNKKALFNTTVTTDMWLRNGVNLGVMSYKTDDGRDIVVDSLALYNQLQNDPRFVSKFTKDIESGRYKTNKIEGTFKNIQELWEYFGSVDNDNSWEEVAEVICNYAGNSTEISLKDSTYPIRNAYIEKVGPTSQQKMGSKNTISFDRVANPNSDFKDCWVEVDNTYHGIILQPDHNPDTTEGNSLMDSNEEEDPNSIPMINQVLASLIAEGRSLEETVRTYNAVGLLSDNYIDGFRSKLKTNTTNLIYTNIINQVSEKLPELDIKVVEEQVTKFLNDRIKFEELSSDIKNAIKGITIVKNADIENYYNLDASGELANLADSAANNIIKEAVKSVNKKELLDQIKRTLTVRGGGGPIGEMIIQQDSDDISLDLKQILPLATSVLNSTFNKETVRQKFAGGQYVVSPSHKYVTTYIVNGIDGYTRDQLNDLLYNGTDEISEDVYNYSKLVKGKVNPNDKIKLIQDIPGLQTNGIYKLSYINRFLKNIGKTKEEIDNILYSGEYFNYRLGRIDEVAQNLKWVQYYRLEGDKKVSLLDTDELKAFHNINSIVRDINNTKKTMATLGNNMIILKAAYSNVIKKVPLSASTYLDIDTSVIDQLTEEEKYKLVSDFVKNNNGVNLKDLFEVVLFNELNSGRWTSTTAEFYMPPMHQKRFFLKDGDTVNGILGKTRPDYDTLILSDIIKLNQPYTINKKGDTIRFNTKEDIIRFAKNNSVQFRYLLKTIKKESPLFIAKFIKDSESQDKSIKDFFTKRINDFSDELITKYSKEGTTIEDIATELADIWINNPSSNRYIRSSMDAFVRNLIVNSNTNSDDVVIKNALKEFRSSITESMPTIVGDLSSGFESSLDFISARIPAQGKQSGTACTIKDFIFKSRNACYGPLEMLIMTGADYDIDKQNMMTWHFNSEGRFIDWGIYTDEFGRIDVSKLHDRLKDMNSSARSIEQLRFKKAVQNFIVHNIYSVLKDPKNAIEANTPISMDNVSKAKIPVNTSKAIETKTVADTVRVKNFALPFTPSTTWKYEKITMDGKGGIGIFASDLKAYFATMYAFAVTSINSKYTQFKDSLYYLEAIKDLIPVKKDPTVYEITDSWKDIKKNAVHFFDLKTGELKSQSETIGNGDKFLEKYKIDRSKINTALKSMKGKSDEEQVAILTQYADIINSTDNDSVKEQAWENLSELLSAATDNAKEMVLGQINATSMTSSIISTIVRLGIPLKYALELVGDNGNNPVDVVINEKQFTVNNIRELVKVIEDTKDTQKGIVDGINLTSTLEKIVSRLQIPTTTEEAVKYLSNPYRQLLTFAKISEEFATISYLLSINQNLKNDSFSVTNFINSIESKVIGKNNKLNFNLSKFVNELHKEAIEHRDSEYINDMVAKYEESKAGINVLHVLRQNKHFVGYYRAMITSKNIIRSVSNLSKSADTIIDKLSDKVISKQSIDKDSFSKLHDYIYGAGIVKFVSENRTNFVLGDKVFDLSKNSSEGKVGGRLEFMLYVPEAINKHIENQRKLIEEKNKGGVATTVEDYHNMFLSNLSYKDSKIDYATQLQIPSLSIPNIENITTDRQIQLEAGISQLMRENKQLYDALFLYTLIAYKGSYSGGSFMIFYPDEFLEFSKFMVKNDNILNIELRGSTKSTDKASINELKVARMNNPIFTRKVSIVTSTVPGNQEDSEPFDQEDVHSYDSDQEEFGYSVKKSINSRPAALYNTTQLDSKDGLVVVKETGIMYAWDPDLDVYVPLVQRIPSLCIPFTVNINSSDIKDSGFDYGLKVSLGEETGNIVAFIKNSSSFYDNKKILTFLGKYNTVGGNTLLDELSEAEKLNTDTKNTDMYLVRTGTIGSGFKYKVMSSNSLKAFDTTKTLILENYKFLRTNSLPSKRTLETTDYYIDSNGVTSKVDNKTTKYSFTAKEIVSLDSIPMKEDLFTEFDTDAINTIERFLSSLNISIKGTDILTNIDSVIENSGIPDKKALIPVLYQAMITESKGNITTFLKYASKLGLTKEEQNNTIKSLVSDYFETTDDIKAVQYTIKNGNIITIVKTPKKASKSISLSEGFIPNDLKKVFTEKASPTIISKLLNHIQTIMPDTPFLLLSTSEIEISYGKEYVAEGIKAFTKDGEVIMNGDRVTIDTPLHEFGHIYIQHLKYEDNELYNKIVREALLHPITQTIRNTYSNLSDEDLGEEVFVHLLSGYSKSVTEDISIFEKILSYTAEGPNLTAKIARFFEMLFHEVFGTELNIELNMHDSLQSIISILGNNIAYGEGSIFKDISKSTRDLVDMSNGRKMLSYDLAYKLLSEKGFIQKVCI